MGRVWARSGQRQEDAVGVYWGREEPSESSRRISATDDSIGLDFFTHSHKS